MALPTESSESLAHDSDISEGPPPVPPKDSPLAAPDSVTLTPLRAHYLKRELVTQQLLSELDTLSTPDALELIGPPFKTHKTDNQDSTSSQPNGAVDLPFIRFIFHHFVLSFPFLYRTQPSFFSDKLQPFVHSFLSRNISGTDEREEDTKRREITGNAEKYFGLVLSSAIKLTENNGREDIVRVEDDVKVTPSVPLLREDASMPASVSSQPTVSLLPTSQSAQAKRRFDINVVTVRNVVTQGRMRKRIHEYFVIRTRRKGCQDVYVCRRYGDFSLLAEKLRSAFPEQDIRGPPPKDRKKSEAWISPTASSPQVHTPDNIPNSPLAFDDDNNSVQNATSPSSLHSIPALARERNRLTLRAYLHHLLGIPRVPSSTELRSFLLDSPITLTSKEIRDMEVREEMDRSREEEGNKFKEEINERVAELESHLRNFRAELVRKDGLTRIFATIRSTPKMEDLPIEYLKLIEWARISLASAIYQLFVGADDSSEVFGQLKRIHGMMPYFLMRGVLRISNPVSMIRGLLDLFLARPFGQTSLIQRMFSSGLSDEVKELRSDMEMVAEKIENPVMVEKVWQFVQAPREIQSIYQTDAVEDKVDLMTVILRSPEEPFLDRESLERVRRANQAYMEYCKEKEALDDPEQDPGPSNDDAWLFEDLHVYKRMATRLRDKEQMIELVFEGGTSELLKEIITIFYEPLARVYKAANIADSLYDLQMFLNDLIRTVEQAEESNQHDASRTVQAFVDLVARHEASFYNFVHSVHSRGEGVFDNLMKWIELIINFIREGLPQPVSLEFILPHATLERNAIMDEVDAVIEYHRKLKTAYRDRSKRRMLRGAADQRDADQAFVEGVMQHLSIGDVSADVQDLKATETDEEEDLYDSSTEESIVSVQDEEDPVPDDPLGDEEEDEDDDSSVLDLRSPEAKRAAAEERRESRTQQYRNASSKPEPAANTPVNPPIQNTRERAQSPRINTNTKNCTYEGGLGNRRKNKKCRKAIEPPTLEHIPRLAPLFVEMLRPALDEARSRGTNLL